MPRVTRTGDHANRMPARIASGSDPVRYRASRNIAYAVSTIVVRYTTLNAATTPSGSMSGSASRFANVV